jgi:chromosome segregation ATPase
VLDDCFQLISLFFLTIGRNSEAPAVYSATSTAKRLLDHLKEAGFYSPKDLESIESYLKQWEESMERGRETHSPHLINLIEARIHVCQHRIQELKESLSRLSPELMETYEKLVSILRQLSAANTRSKVG